jgi:hypothetical protein
MSTMISIDYDFFIPHGMYEPEIYLPAANDTMPGDLVYDWQMGEGRDPGLQDVIWRTRCMNFKMWGLDIEELTKPPLSIEDFITELSIKLSDYGTPAAYMADSHAWGAIVARDYAKACGPLRVVNFDAHHDLGYDTIPKRLNCDNWALHGLQDGWISDYTVVYPDWLGLKEWEDRKMPWLKGLKKKTHVMTWSDWILSWPEIEDPEVAFLCRSSAWTPPWADPGFQELADEFFTTCLDCQHQAESPYNACELREWDWQEVDDEIVLRRTLLEELRKRT